MKYKKGVFLLGGHELKYKIFKKRVVKNLSFVFKKKDTLIVSIPWWFSFEKALCFIEENKEYILSRLIEIKKRPIRLIEKGSRDDYLKNKEKARKLVLWKVQQFNEYYNFKISKIAIRNQSTRWGSCSSRNNLNFNYRIIYLPSELSDYLVVHEICHLKEMNHSKNFWNLVSETIPNYKELSRKLRVL